MTVGLCMDDVEIGLAAHLRYIRPCTRTDRIVTRVTKGGLRPNHINKAIGTSLMADCICVHVHCKR